MNFSSCAARALALILIGVYRLSLWAEAAGNRWEKWLEKWFPTIVAALILLAVVSFYAAESIMCSADIGNCRFANASLGNWLYPK